MYYELEEVDEEGRVVTQQRFVVVCVLCMCSCVCVCMFVCVCVSSPREGGTRSPLCWHNTLHSVTRTWRRTVLPTHVNEHEQLFLCINFLLSVGTTLCSVCVCVDVDRLSDSY